MSQEISIIVPCLNEEQNIPTLVQKLIALIDQSGLSPEILVIDDCSDDHTFHEAFILSSADSRVKALHKGFPRGIGNAIRFGIQHASGRVGVVVTEDVPLELPGGAHIRMAPVRREEVRLARARGEP